LLAAPFLRAAPPLLAVAPLAEARVFFVAPVVAVASGGPLVDLLARDAVLVARFAGAEPLAAFAADRLPGDLVAVRFTGLSVAGLVLVAATYTPSVGLTSGGFGHGEPKVSAMSNVGV
jgi:hypothetical protein